MKGYPRVARTLAIFFMAGGLVWSISTTTKAADKKQLEEVAKRYRIEKADHSTVAQLLKLRDKCEKIKDNGKKRDCYTQGVDGRDLDVLVHGKVSDDGKVTEQGYRTRMRKAAEMLHSTVFKYVDEKCGILRGGANLGGNIVDASNCRWKQAHDARKKMDEVVQLGKVVDYNKWKNNKDAYQPMTKFIESHCGQHSGGAYDSCAQQFMVRAAREFREGERALRLANRDAVLANSILKECLALEGGKTCKGKSAKTWAERAGSESELSSLYGKRVARENSGGGKKGSGGQVAGKKGKPSDKGGASGLEVPFGNALGEGGYSVKNRHRDPAKDASLKKEWDPRYIRPELATFGAENECPVFARPWNCGTEGLQDLREKALIEGEKSSKKSSGVGQHGSGGQKPQLGGSFDEYVDLMKVVLQNELATYHVQYVFSAYTTGLAMTNPDMFYDKGKFEKLKAEFLAQVPAKCEAKDKLKAALDGVGHVSTVRPPSGVSKGDFQRMIANDRAKKEKTFDAIGEEMAHILPILFESQKKIDAWGEARKTGACGLNARAYESKDSKVNEETRQKCLKLWYAYRDASMQKDLILNKSEYTFLNERVADVTAPKKTGYWERFKNWAKGNEGTPRWQILMRRAGDMKDKAKLRELAQDEFRDYMTSKRIEIGKQVFEKVCDDSDWNELATKAVLNPVVAQAYFDSPEFDGLSERDKFNRGTIYCALHGQSANRKIAAEVGKGGIAAGLAAVAVLSGPVGWGAGGAALASGAAASGYGVYLGVEGYQRLRSESADAVLGVGTLESYLQAQDDLDYYLAWETALGAVDVVTGGLAVGHGAAQMFRSVDDLKAVLRASRDVRDLGKAERAIEKLREYNEFLKKAELAEDAKKASDAQRQANQARFGRAIAEAKGADLAMRTKFLDRAAHRIEKAHMSKLRGWFGRQLDEASEKDLKLLKSRNIDEIAEAKRIACGGGLAKR